MVKISKTTKKRFEGLGARVRALRIGMGLSLQVAATRGGTTPAPFIELERNDLATTRTLNCVARALGVDVDTLTGRKAAAS